jgi:ectoine hydroxylase-related dioxygenase (phytanoyl-CoA dioxygenase family)
MGTITHETPGLTPDFLDANCPGGFDGEPLELVMCAGSVCFWHHWMGHNSNYNASDQPRQAVFTRWHNRRADVLTQAEVVLKNPLLDGEALGQTRTICAGFDIGGVISDKNLWKWWTQAVQTAAEAADMAKL